MDQNTVDNVTRSEYESFVRTYEVRHAELRNEIKEVEVDLKQQLNTMNLKLDTLSTQLATHGTDIWRSIALSLTGGVLGYLISVAQHILVK